MTDPHHANNSGSNVYPLAADRKLSFPTQGLSPPTNAQPSKATDQLHVQPGSNLPGLVDGIQSPGTGDLFQDTDESLHDPDSNRSRIFERDIDIGAARYSNIAPTDGEDAAHGNLTSDTLTSQDWPAQPGHHFNFPPQTIYEHTGELVYEEPLSFQQFDNPATIDNSLGTFPVPGFPNISNSSDIGYLPSDRADVDVFVQPALPRSALKRKADPNGSLLEQGLQKKGTNSSTGPPRPRRVVSFERMSRNGQTVPDEGKHTSDLPFGQRATYNSISSEQHRGAGQSSTSAPRVLPQGVNTSPVNRPSRGGRHNSAHPPAILPPEKVFPIQIGSELFRLSGASISSDAPSYFTQFFEEQIRQGEDNQGMRTLYIDRDPATFKDVARHLQGYHVKPVNGSHFVKLFADAQFYSLPRLVDQLFESEIFIQIGEQHFQIPKDIFTEPGNSPNFFSLGFAVFSSTPGEAFPGLDRRGLLRPPSITPPYVPGRSAEIFAQLLHLLRGYPLDIRNEAHRTELLRDCRYFHLRGLEQKIIAHEISYNLQRGKHEICLRLEDVKPSGISFKADEIDTEQSTAGGWVYYARPFVDETSYEMLIEIGGECTALSLDDMRADFHNLTRARVASLFQVVANKMNLPTNAPLGLMMLSGGTASQSASPGHTPLSEDRVKVRFDSSTDIKLNGQTFDIDFNTPQGQIMAYGPSAQQERDEVSLSSTGNTQQSAARKRKRQASSTSDETSREWTIRTAQWRLRVQPVQISQQRNEHEIVLVGVKVDAFSNERARNARKSFLA